MKKLTTKEFIERAKEVHGDKYDYSLTEYNGTNSKIKIICKNHGMFLQRASSHINTQKQGCGRCAFDRKKLTNDEFIKIANEIHNNKYDYSLVEYINSHSKIKIICQEHNEFKQNPNNHLSGQGCRLCYDKKNTLSNEEFIERVKLIHGDKYDYSLVDYTHNMDKIKIICHEHGIFEQRASGHLSGKRCLKCVIKEQTLTTKEFIKRAKEVHGDKYDYSLANYINDKIKISIICSKHGEFNQKPSNHTQGQGCPVCKESRGEKEIRDILKENAIIFENQKKFDDCRNINPLPFDFYLPEYNICIEYNGRQHYQTVSNNFFGDEEQLMQTQKRDKIKYHYCKNNDIKLVVIKYDENISEKVNELLTTLKVMPQ